MLRTLHNFIRAGKSFYGMNRGTIGFLMNEYHEDGLKERLAAAQEGAECRLWVWWVL
jgi:NAD+ kinase